MKDGYHGSNWVHGWVDKGWGILVDEGYQGWVSWLMKEIKDGYLD